LNPGTATSEKHMLKAKSEGCVYLYTHMNNLLTFGAESYL